MARTSGSEIRRLLIGNRPGRPWTTFEKVVGILLAALAIAFAAICTGLHHPGQASNLTELAMDLIWVAMVGGLIYLSIKHPEIRRGFRVGRRR